LGKIVGLSSIIGFVLHIVGFATAYWTNVSMLSYHQGLWQVCALDICSEVDFSGTAKSFFEGGYGKSYSFYDKWTNGLMHGGETAPGKIFLTSSFTFLLD